MTSVTSVKLSPYSSAKLSRRFFFGSVPLAVRTSDIISFTAKLFVQNSNRSLYAVPPLRGGHWPKPDELPTTITQHVFVTTEEYLYYYYYYYYFGEG